MKEGYKKTELGWIPNEWEINKLSSISEIIMGQSPDSNSYNDEKIGIPFFQGKTEFGRINPIVKKWCSNPIKISQPQDILISVRAPVGEVNINIEESCIGRGLAAIRQKNCDYKFLFYYMQKIKNRLNLSAQGSTFTAINSGDLKNISIITPPLEEQQKIADILSTVDSQIDDTDKLIEKTKELKKGLMQRLLTKGIGHSEFKKSEVGEIPVEWEVLKSDQIFDLITDYVANGSFADLNKNVKYTDEEDYAVLVRLMDYKNNYNGPFVYVDKSAYDFLKKSKLEANDIIISNVGAYAGYVFRAPNIGKPITLGPNAILVRSKENKEFIYYWLSSDIGQKSIREIISTTAQPKFNKTDFKKIKIPVPPSIEQQKIADILLAVDTQISEYENKKLKLEELKKGLMQQLLTGKIRVI